MVPSPPSNGLPAKIWWMTPPVLKPGLLASPRCGDQGTAALLSVPLLRSLATLDLVWPCPVGRGGTGMGSCLGASSVPSSSHRNTWRRENEKEEITGHLSFLNLKPVGTCQILDQIM